MDALEKRSQALDRQREADRAIVEAHREELPAWPELHEAALHGLAGRVVRTLAPHTEADPAGLLVQFLVAFGNAVGRSGHYRVEGDDHPGNLFAVLVGESAKARKGTSWGRIRELFTLIDDPWAERNVHGGLSSGEGLIHAVRDGGDPNDDTSDPGVQDKRLLVVEPEFGAMLRVMGREGNSLSRVIRDAWDRGDLATLTKHSPSVATGAHISIIGHCTRDELKRNLTSTEAGNGFGNRFLFCAVRRARVLPFGGAMDAATLHDLGRALAAAVFRARGRLEMDEGARGVWETVYPELSEGRAGLLGAITGRAEAQVVRLALLYALLDEADAIEAEHLRAALALWEFCEASAEFIFGDSLGDPVADDLLTALRGAGAEGLTRSELSDVLSRNATADRIRHALDLLQRAGKVDSERQPTRGRPVEVWRARL